MTMSRYLALLLSLPLSAAPTFALAMPAFPASPLASAGHRLTIAVDVPRGHALYADKLKVAAPLGWAVGRLQLPAPSTFDDPEKGPVPAYLEPFILVVHVEGAAGSPSELTLTAQGCDYVKGICYTPEAQRVPFDRP